MALSDLQIKVASETAVIGLQKHMAPLYTLAHNFKELEGKKGAAIAVPVFKLDAAAEFNSSTNNWCSSEEIDGLTVTLDKHFIKSITLDDVTAGDSDVNILRDGTKAITEVLARAANSYTFGLINSTNVETTAEVPAVADFTKDAVAALFAAADANGVNPYESVLVLNPSYFAKTLANMDAIVYGGDEGVKRGVIPGLYGFRDVVCTSYLPEGTVGAIVPYGTLGIASRVNAPAINGYVATFDAVDENGFALGFRAFEHLCEGRMILGGDVLFGAKILQDGIVRLVPADESSNSDLIGG